MKKEPGEACRRMGVWAYRRENALGQPAAFQRKKGIDQRDKMPGCRESSPIRRIGSISPILAFV
jgi:hypothetical protein